LVDRYLGVLEPLGIFNAPRTPFIKLNSSVDATVETLLKKEKAQSGSLLVGLFPGAGHAGRCWPLKNFAELADFLIRNNRVRVIVFAGPEETKALPEMKKLFPTSCIFFTRLTIAQLASAQARLTMFITNDTGPMHIAAAVGTSVITIMDRPTPHAYVPIGDQHRLIFGKTVHDISVEQVYKVAHELLASNRTAKLFSSEQR
jgi:ADP-heptose:LPS heptosyltransferase